MLETSDVTKRLREKGWTLLSFRGWNHPEIWPEPKPPIRELPIVERFAELAEPPAQVRCTHCGKAPAPGTSVVVTELAGVQEWICQACFMTEDANAPWDHMGQVDVAEDGSLRWRFPEED